MTIAPDQLMLQASGFFSSSGAGPEVLVGLAILGGLLGLLRGIPKMTHAISLADKAFRQIVGDDKTPGIGDALVSISSRVEVVEKEMRPNGGGSIRDSLNRLEAGVAEAKRAADQVAHKLNAANERTAKERERLHAEMREGRGMITALLNALDEFAQDSHQKEVAYVRALKGLGIDLTAVTDQLDQEERP